MAATWVRLSELTAARFATRLNSCCSSPFSFAGNLDDARLVRRLGFRDDEGTTSPCTCMFVCGTCARGGAMLVRTRLFVFSLNSFSFVGRVGGTNSRQHLFVAGFRLFPCRVAGLLLIERAAKHHRLEQQRRTFAEA